MCRKRKAVRLMKCPKCGINLLEHIDVCPFCKTPVTKETASEEPVKKAEPVTTNTGRFSTVDPAKDSYDFDLQYTLTFRDAGEIKQAIADMDANNAKELPKRNKEYASSSGEPKYTREEMQEAALRAQMRREKRKGGTVSGSVRKSHSVSERRKLSALRAAKPKAAPSAEKQYKSHKGLLLGTGVLALVIILIVGIVNICAYFANKDPEYPTLYTKGNELYSYSEGKAELLSSNFITINASTETNKTSDSSSSSSSSSGSSKKFVDPKTKTKAQLTEKKLVNVSENGKAIYFLENVNMETGAGNLVYYETGKKKSRTVLAQNVYYDIVVGNSGVSILYLKNADKDGAHGELCYWTPGLKESVSVESDITAGNFKMAYDSMSATYIKNFNPTVHTGDLCYVSFAEGAEPSKRVDEKVAFVFGTTPKSKAYFYAKNYDTKAGTYDLYVQSDSEGPKAVAEKGLLAPIISKKTEIAYVYSNYKDNFQTLSCVDLATGVNTTLSEEVTEVIKVRNDDGAVIYSKEYESKKADYYFVNSKTPNPQTVATAINTEGMKKDGIVAFDASDDFSKIAYIGGYDVKTKKGALYTMSILNDYAGSEMRISDDAFSCDVSADGAVVRFAAGYREDSNTVNLVSYLNSTTLALSDGVAAGAFTFDKMGEYAIYAKEVNSDNVVGRIETVNKKAKIKQLDDNVSAYGLKKDGTVLLLKKATEGENQLTTLYKTTLKGGKAKLISDGIGKVLSY